MRQIPGSGAACASRLVGYSPAHNATATNMFQAMPRHIGKRSLIVRFGSKADMVERVGMSALCQKRTYAVQQKGPLFDHLVGALLANIFISSPSQMRTGKGVNTWSSTAATRTTPT